MELEKSKQLFFRFIYSLGLIKLETLKTYIKTSLVNGFIRLSKSLPKVFVFFD